MASETKTADVPSNRTEPTEISDRNEVPAELAAGRWVVYPHDALPDSVSVESWADEITKLCRAQGVTAAVITSDEQKLTVIVNAEKPPTPQQIAESIAVLKANRDQPAKAAA